MHKERRQVKTKMPNTHLAKQGVRRNWEAKWARENGLESRKGIGWLKWGAGRTKATSSEKAEGLR